MYTLRQAAKATGKAPNTIRNAIKKGRITASKDDAGQFSISPSELHRIYPVCNEHTADGVNLHNIALPIEQAAHSAEIESLNAKIAMLEQMVEREREHADEWRKQAQNLALTHDRSPAPSSSKPGLLQRLFGNGAI